MAVSTIQDIIDAEINAGVYLNMMGGASGTTTSAVAASNNFTLQLLRNALGTTLPGGPYVGFPVQPGIRNNLRLMHMRSMGNRAIMYAIANFINLGQIGFTATGSRFTHHSSTAPYSKNQMGQPSPVHGPLFLDFITATSVTAPIISSLTYVDQDGNTQVGTKTWTAPAAATLLGSGFLLPLEDGSSGARDLTSVTVGTASTTGVANVYLLDIVKFIPQVLLQYETIADCIDQGAPPLLDYPTANTGTADVGLFAFGITNSTSTAFLHGKAVALP